ncbi:MAG: T9SS type B sorting domain-containing protein [Psychroserpens sp.]|uniref:T9SS type B sorting domain-containing protein n=1 Tax=Psychroserpens sp. TaxID=2020870 RepID=UPI003002CDA1
MGKYFNNLNVIIIFSIFFSSEMGYAQLGFCQGNSGDPIFVEDFSAGLADTSLPSGTTTYNYANGGQPLDGLYTVSSNTNFFDWFSVQDHTPNDVNGRMLVVNSAAAAGEFYRTNINGLCENTSYEFSSWIVNLTPAGGFCGAGAIPVNVRFEIWDNTDANLLASGDTGNINSSGSPNWQQYALVFQTIPSQTSVILKMINNGAGGCGNDLAIDDIVFKSCGDFIEVRDTVNNDSISLCSSETPFSTTLTATPDNTVFSNHFYQWQESPDENIWTDIAGATSDNIILTGISSTMYYRVKVAEFAANLSNLDCITFSTTYELIINQAPNPPTIACWETATLNNTTCSWEVSGTQPPEPTGLECWESTNFNTTTCSWEIIGTQPAQPTLECWETTTFNNTTCLWEVSGTQPIEPAGLECWESTNFNTTTCLWEVTGTQPTQPALECWETATFNTTTCSWDVSGSQLLEPTGLECWEVTNFNITTCSWEVTGTQPVLPIIECWETATFNTTTCSWEITGTQLEAPTNLECWETATFIETSCSWEITGIQTIDTIEEFSTICEGEDITLQASTDISNATYQWDSGETTEFITVSSPGTYVVVTTDGCATIEKTIVVEQPEAPIIESIQSDGNDIIVLTSNSGNFIYSLDGINFQTNNIFYDVDGGKYTIYVKSIDCDTNVTTTHLHFYIPKFITPNNDGRHDTFSLLGIDCFASSEVFIFNRYGKLLFSAYDSPANWNGTMNGKDLPTSDYWYLIIIEGQEFRGHFTLKR